MAYLSRTLSALSKSLVLILAIAVLAANIGGVKPAADIAVAALGLFVLLEFRNLPRLARVFAVGAVLAVLLIVVFRPDATGQMIVAMRQGTTFACLLAMLGVLRYPARRSRLVARAAAWLVSRRPRHAFAALLLGSHFLSLLFNVGVLPLIGDMIRKAGGRFDEGEPGQVMLMAGMRGMSLMTVWSPMGLGFAIVTTSTAGLNPVTFLFLALAVTLVLLFVSWLTAEPVEHAVAADEAGRHSVMPLVQILVACALLMLAAILLHDFLSVSFVVATILILPVFSVAWLLLEGEETGIPASASLVTGLKGIFATLSDMRTEAAVFGAATLIGAALTIFISGVPGWQTIAEGPYSGLPVLVACLVVIPLAAAAAVPHTIFVVLVAQLFGHGPLGAEHPMALALTLTLSWALAIAVSPISATTLITANQAGVPGHVVGMKWNRRFALIETAVSIVIVALVYFAGI